MGNKKSDRIESINVRRFRPACFRYCQIYDVYPLDKTINLFCLFVILKNE